MEDQAEAVLESETAAQEQADEESAMLSSFAQEAEISDQSTTLPTEESEASAKPDESTPSMEASPAVTVQTESVQDKEAEVLSRLERLTTLEANIKKLADEVGGRVGSIEQIIRTLQAATPAGEAISVSAEDFKELQEEFPMLADLQVKALNRVMGKVRGTGVSPDFIGTVVKDSEAAAQRAVMERLDRERTIECRETLNETHEGWLEIVGLADKDVQDGGVPPDTEYRRWLKAQPSGYQQRINSTFSPFVIGKSIEKFQAWKEAQAAPKPQPSVSKPSTRHQHLRAAVVPKASGSTEPAHVTMSEEDAMMSSFGRR